MGRLLFLLLIGMGCAAQETPQAFIGARLIPISGPEVESAGRVIMPGLVDTHSHAGGVEGGD